MGMYVLIFVGSVFISSVSQILLKKSTGQKHENALKEYLNVRVIVAYALFFLSTLVTMLAYKKVPLSMGPIIESSGYLFVALLGYFFLNEKVSKRKVCGLALIILGIIVFNL